MSLAVEPDIHPAIVFSLVTVPDVAGLRRMHRLPAALVDNEVVEFAYQKGRARADISNAPDVLPFHLHRIVSIACAWQDEGQLRVKSLADSDADEAALIQRFFSVVAQCGARGFSWNSAALDLPVLQYRAVINEVVSEKTGCEIHDLSRLLAGGADTSVSLQEMADLCGFPLVPRLTTGQLWDAWRIGEAAVIHEYCVAEAVTCHLVFLRFQLMRGLVDATEYAERISGVRRSLAELDMPPWREYLENWV